MLYIYNYLSRKKEKFVSLHSNAVGMYVCGPTVYGDPHLGTARCAIVFDMLYRYFLYKGYRVRYVRNITDVGHLEDEVEERGEDKIAKLAKIEKKEPMEVAHYYTSRYRDGLSMLNVLPATIEPLASAHIYEQIGYIEELLSKGVAYKANGSVYFDLVTFLKRYKTYGKLSGKQIDNLLAGQRTLVGQSEKRSELDFALWKKAEDSHIMKWKTPWEKKEGFPGWHIECSAMSEKYLGVPFDIHGGGIDLQFPHHEAEIAQCYGRHNTIPAQYWLYNNMVTVCGKKMSKSFENFITLEQFFKGDHPSLSKAYSPEAVRFFLLRSHYRNTLDISDEALHSVEIGMKKLQQALRISKGVLFYEQSPPFSRKNIVLREHIDQIAEKSEAKAIYNQLFSYFEDDMNLPVLIPILFSIAKKIISWDKAYSDEFKDIACVYYDFCANILGLKSVFCSSKRYDALISYLIDMRKNARDEKDYALSDSIRNILESTGVQVQDTPDGATWTSIEE